MYRYWRTSRERSHQLWLPQNGRDVPPPYWQIGQVRPSRYCDQPNHLRGPVRPAPHRAGARHGNQAHTENNRPILVRGETRRRDRNFRGSPEISDCRRKPVRTSDLYIIIERKFYLQFFFSFPDIRINVVLKSCEVDWKSVNWMECDETICLNT